MRNVYHSTGESESLAPKTFTDRQPGRGRSRSLTHVSGANDHFEIEAIEDLHDALRKRQVENTLCLFFEENSLFNGWERDGLPSISRFDVGDLQSFRDLVRTKAFLPADQRDWNERPKTVISPKQKDILALRLAHSLAQFFLHTKPVRPDWSSSKVFLLENPGNTTQRDLYVSFSAADQGPPWYPIRLGEPALLEFSRLLLEMKTGREIDLSQFEDPIMRWAELCNHTHQGKEQLGPLYTDAIEGALLLHKFGRPREGESPTTALQRTIEERILRHLKNAANPPSALGTKRKGSDSEPPTKLAKRPRPPSPSSTNPNGAAKIKWVNRPMSCGNYRLLTLRPACKIPTHE